MNLEPDKKETMMIERPKLYVGCALKFAPEGFREMVARLKATLQERFDVLEFMGLTDGTDEEVACHDLKQVEDCDLMLAVADYPSLGLGIELGYAGALEKPVLIVAHVAADISRVVVGLPAKFSTICFARYLSAEQIPGMVLEFAIGQKLIEG